MNSYRMHVIALDQNAMTIGVTPDGEDTPRWRLRFPVERGRVDIYNPAIERTDKSRIPNSLMRAIRGYAEELMRTRQWDDYKTVEINE